MGEPSCEISLDTSSGNNSYTVRALPLRQCRRVNTFDLPSESRVEVKIFSLYLYNAFFSCLHANKGTSRRFIAVGGGEAGGFWKDDSIFGETGGRGYSGGKQIIKEDLMRVLFRASPLPQTVRQVRGKKYTGYE